MVQIKGLTLVTGGTGFLGGRVIERLGEQGTPTRALVRRQLPKQFSSIPVETHLGDLVDARTLTGLCEGVDTVIHCAGLVTDYAPYRQFMRVNGTGTSNLIDEALRAGVRRFVHISTTDVYGYASTPRSEDDPTRVTGLGYNDSKIYAEAVVRGAGAKHQFPFTIVRPANIYGPGSAFVDDIAAELMAGRMVLFDDGQQDAGLVYVDNVVDLIFTAAVCEKALGETYNACDCNGVTWQQYCDILAEILGCPPCRTYMSYRLAYAIGALMEHSSLFLGRRKRPLLTRTAVKLLGIPGSHKNDKARRELGWFPRLSFEEAMHRIRAALRDRQSQKK